MSCKSLRVLPLIGALVLFLTGSVRAQAEAPPRREAEQPRTHTVTINNGNQVVRRTFVWQNGSWRSCGDYKKEAKPKKDRPAPGIVFPDVEDLLKRFPQGMDEEQLKEMRKRLQPLQRRGLIQKPFDGGLPAFRFPNAPFGRQGRASESVQEARLGVQLRPPSATLVDQLDLPRDQGMVLAEVGPNSAAAKAGMKVQDVLLEVNGKPVSSKWEEFDKLLATVEANKQVDAVVMRKGKKETIKGLSLPEA